MKRWRKSNFQFPTHVLSVWYTPSPSLCFCKRPFLQMLSSRCSLRLSGGGLRRGVLRGGALRRLVRFGQGLIAGLAFVGAKVAAHKARGLDTVLFALELARLVGRFHHVPKSPPDAGHLVAALRRFRRWRRPRSLGSRSSRCGGGGGGGGLDR